MEHVISEGLEGFNGWAAASKTHTDQTLIQNFIQNSGNKRLQFIEGSLATIVATVIPNQDAYTYSTASATKFVGAVLHGSSNGTLKYLPPVGIDSNNGLQFNWAQNQESATTLRSLEIVLSNGAIRTFGITPDPTKAWLGFDEASVDLALVGDNTNNIYGVGWQKFHFTFYKVGDFLKVSMASSRDTVNVLTYTEDIAGLTIASVTFAAARSGGGVTKHYLDDINVYEIQPGDIASEEAGFGQFATYQKHIKQRCVVYDGVNSQAETNGDADDWTGVGGPHANLINGDLAAYAGSTTNQRGFLQLTDFEAMALAGGSVSVAELKTVGFSLNNVADDDGEAMGLKQKNGINEQDATVNPDAGEAGSVNIFAAKGTPAFDVSLGAPTKLTNGMIFTARQIA